MICLRRWISAVSLVVIGRIEGYTRIEGLLVTNVLRSPRESKEFNDSIAQAIKLVRNSSLARYNRIARYISRIQNGDDHFLASFNWPSRICTIDFRKVAQKYSDSVETLGAILVHEAMHGLIWSRGIKPTNKNYAAIESVCKKEELRYWHWLETNTLSRPGNPSTGNPTNDL